MVEGNYGAKNVLVDGEAKVELGGVVVLDVNEGVVVLIVDRLHVGQCDGLAQHHLV